MRSTLFYIPHEILGVPLLGVGWLLLLLFLAFLGWAVWNALQGRFQSEVIAGIPVWLIAAAIVVFLLPQIESRWPDGTPIGLPVRGYGVMVLLGLFSGIGITLWRGKQVGVSPDFIVSLGFWMMLGGVLCARVFFVFQYWDDFATLPWGERIVAIIKLTEGGLVIYGGMVGGALAGWLYCRMNRQPVLAFADLIAPGFLIGLAFGRIGCLLNGCCFGGVCTADLPAIQFPQGSPPYVAQLENGKLLGITLSPSTSHSSQSSTAHGASTDPSLIAKVESNSVAERELSAEPGMTFQEQHQILPPIPKVDDPAAVPKLSANVVINDRPHFLSSDILPAYSRPVHPSQIYSAVDAALLCLLILCVQPWVARDGQAFLLGIGLHGVARFTLELIRSDEAGQFGTTLTIAQWISLLGIALAIAGFIATSRLRAPRAWNYALGS